MKCFKPEAFRMVAVMGFICHLTGFAVLGQWSTDPAVNNLIITGSGQQTVCRIASDGNGGAIITWWDYDLQSGDHNIFAQRIDADGYIKWNPDGVPICTNPAHQQNPEIASDGEGGAIITWFDQRNVKNEIFAQKVDSEGNVQWISDGVSVGTAENHYQHSSPVVVGDGSGGAIIAWQDWRGDLYNADIEMYAQRFSAQGQILWGDGGIPLSKEQGERPRIISDGKGGAIVTWHRYIDTTEIKHFDVYAQQVSASGVTGWGMNGTLVCTYSGDQMRPELAGDGRGGAIVVWEDYRDGHTYSNLCAQRVSSGGLMRWDAAGVVLAPIALGQRWQKITGDGNSGAIVTWQYDNNIIYAQRIDSSGVIKWPTDGAAIGAAGMSLYPDITSDGGTGAVITWYDYRGSGNGDIFAQRINADGEVLWVDNGVGVCRNMAGQVSPVITTDGAGGAIIAWDDARNDQTSSSDIYAQKVNSGGTLGNAGAAGIRENAPSLSFGLGQNYPNPFSENTQIGYTVAESGWVTLQVLDICGREISTLLNREMEPGSYTLTFEANDLEPGIYLYRLVSGTSVVTKSMSLVR